MINTDVLQRNRLPVSDVVRQAISEYGISVTELADRADVDPVELDQFMSRESLPSIELVDRLAPVLGLQLVCEIDWQEWVAERRPENDPWEQQERERLEALGWVSIIGDD